MTPSKPSILIVDDEPMMRGFVAEALGEDAYHLLQAANVNDGLAIAAVNPVDVLITDIRMDGGSGLELVKRFRLTDPTLPIIVMTGYPDTSHFQLTEEMEVGSFLTKPFSATQIRYSVLQGLEKRRVVDGGATEPEVKGDDLGLVGDSEYMRELRRRVRRVTQAEFPVIIQGPSGTGKEIVATAIHRHSARGKLSMLTINCAAVPEHLEEAEFFGHAKGAFTGATGGRAGIIASADGSTLFLDEVGELSQRTQAKLLRVLENGEFMRVGESTPIKVDIRIIAATNRDLAKMVDEGTFRRDLYFRLKGELIETRPLSEHREDIPALVKVFMSRHHVPRGPRLITAGALAFLSEQEWPGNIRELKHTVTLLCHSAAGARRVNTATIESVLRKDVARISPAESYKAQKERHVQEFEYSYFTKLVQKYNGNLTRAAVAAGMHRPNLIKKLKTLGVSPTPYRKAKAPVAA